jgi:hypothetical protein
LNGSIQMLVIVLIGVIFGFASVLWSIALIKHRDTIATVSRRRREAPDAPVWRPAQVRGRVFARTETIVTVLDEMERRRMTWAPQMNVGILMLSSPALTLVVGVLGLAGGISATAVAIVWIVRAVV